jgi:hypothetical protein
MVTGFEKLQTRSAAIYWEKVALLLFSRRIGAQPDLDEARELLWRWRSLEKVDDLRTHGIVDEAGR